MGECAASYGSSVCRVFGNGLKASESVEKFRGTDLWGGEIGAALRRHDGHCDVAAGASGRGWVTCQASVGERCMHPGEPSRPALQGPSPRAQRPGPDRFDALKGPPWAWRGLGGGRLCRVVLAMEMGFNWWC